jgi:hypothetical protein
MNANPQCGEVELTLDKKYIMVLNFKALAIAETIGGFKVFGLTRGDIGVNEFRALGYAGLLKYSPKLTLDKFDELIDTIDRFNGLQKAVLEAMKGSFGQNESAKAEGGEENPQTPASPTPGQGS